ncbi:hypothetical protein IJI69_03425 [Candidatus Saccharibacteria bacterium]|nr:hypothetical protein [Candidatus Saccharibacteria bacterium]
MSKVHKRFREFFADRKRMVAEGYLGAVEDLLDLEHDDCRLAGLQLHEEGCKFIRNAGFMFVLRAIYALLIGLLPGAPGVWCIDDLVRNTIPNTKLLLGPSVEIGLAVVLLVIAWLILRHVKYYLVDGLSLLCLYRKIRPLAGKDYQDLLYERENAVERLNQALAE